MLDGETWRWFTTRLFGLSLESRFWTAMRNKLDKPDTTAAVSKDDVQALLLAE